MEDLYQHFIILTVPVLCVIKPYWEQQVLLWIFKFLLTGELLGLSIFSWVLQIY